MSILKLFRGIFGNSAGRAIADDERHMMDHVPVAATGDNAPIKKKLKAARRRHGKAFKALQQWSRKGEASPQLQALNEKSEQARKGRQRRSGEPARNVTPIARRKS